MIDIEIVCIKPIRECFNKMSNTLSIRNKMQFVDVLFLSALNGLISKSNVIAVYFVIQNVGASRVKNLSLFISIYILGIVKAGFEYWSHICHG